MLPVLTPKEATIVHVTLAFMEMAALVVSCAHIRRISIFVTHMVYYYIMSSFLQLARMVMYCSIMDLMFHLTSWKVQY